MREKGAWFSNNYHSISLLDLGRYKTMKVAKGEEREEKPPSPVVWWVFEEEAKHKGNVLDHLE